MDAMVISQRDVASTIVYLKHKCCTAVNGCHCGCHKETCFQHPLETQIRYCHKGWICSRSRDISHSSHWMVKYYNTTVYDQIKFQHFIAAHFQTWAFVHAGGIHNTQLEATNAVLVNTGISISNKKSLKLLAASVNGLKLLFKLVPFKKKSHYTHDSIGN